MTAPPLEREIQTDPRVSDRATKTIQASGEDCLHPDVVAICKAMGYVNPAKRAWIQRKYDALMSDAVDGLDYAAVLTMLRRSGSVSVDRMAERVTRRLAR